MAAYEYECCVTGQALGAPAPPPASFERRDRVSEGPRAPSGPELKRHTSSAGLDWLLSFDVKPAALPQKSRPDPAFPEVHASAIDSAMAQADDPQ